MAEEFINDIIASVTPEKTADVALVVPVEKYLDSGEKSTPIVDKTAPSKEISVSPSIEELATQLGWRVDHEGEDSVDAKTYILRSKDIQQSMSQHNKELKNQLTALNGSVEALKVHNEKVYQADIKKLQSEITDLKKERRSAIELADVDKVDALDKQIDEKQKDIDAPKSVDKQDQNVNPVYDTWIKDNQWYLNDKDMAKFADTIAQQYQGAPLERLYPLVRQKVQEVFPDKFDVGKTNDNVVKLPIGPKSPVESSSGKGNTSSFTKANLSEAQISIMNQFVRGKIMTEAQYINDIAKMQD